MGSETERKVSGSLRRSWRKVIAFIISPAAAAILSAAVSNHDMEPAAPLRTALAIFQVMVVIMYPLSGIAGLAVTLAARRWPQLRGRMAFVGLSGLVCLCLAWLFLWLDGADSVIADGLFFGFSGAINAVTYCVIAGLPWRATKDVHVLS